MITSLMVLLVLIGFLIAGAATALHGMQRTAGRPVRWIWASAIALLLLLSVAAPLRQSASHRPIEVTSSVVGRPTETNFQEPATPLSRLFAAVGDTRRRLAAPIVAVVEVASRAPNAVQRAALVLWVLSSLTALLVMARVFTRVQRQRRVWPVQSLHGATVRVSPDAGPAVMGIAPPEIVIPTWVLARDESEQRLVLAHELQHVRAHDPLLLMLGCVAVALMPWHPAMWYLWSRLRLAIELDCDRRVLRAGAAPHVYGRLLIDLSGQRSALSFGMPAFSYSASHLERRLIAMTSQPARFVVARRFSATFVAALAVLAACESNLPTSAEISAMDVAATTKRAAAAGMDTANIRYVVDGKQVTEEEAKKLSAEKIATVTFARAEATAKPGSVVEVRTMPGVELRGDSISFARSLQVNGKTGALVAVRLPQGQSVVATQSSAARKFDGLLLIDGVITEASRLNSLDSDTIESVEVIKGPAAAAKYSDPRAANGVILVKLKK